MARWTFTFLFTSTITAKKKGRRISRRMIQFKVFLKPNDEKSLSLTTFLMYQQPNCLEWEKVEINQEEVEKSRILFQQV